MVVLTRIYTRTGDDGTTGLVSGERRSKTDQRFEAIGTVDELNAAVGLARLHADGAFAGILARIQNDLFDLGADLATPAGGTADGALRIVAAQVTRLEAEIDALNAELKPLTSFVLPGGTPLAAALHHCRTVARRAEREILRLRETETVNAEAARYVNRLSDHFFVAARHANDLGRDDILWRPGENRS